MFPGNELSTQRVASVPGRFLDRLQIGLSCVILSDLHRGPGAAARQAEILRSEGVDVVEDAMGEFSVDFARFGWFPDERPSDLQENDGS